MPHDWRALEAKWMGVGRLDANSRHRRIGEARPSIAKKLMADILCIPFDQWGAALIYFTGELAISLRVTSLTTGNEIVRCKE
jgi:DNA polymerase lambda